MNVNNEINKHEAYTIDDISSIKLDLDFEESISHLPECIICRLTDLEGWDDEELEENTFCPCNFYYHDSCYEEWIQYKKSNKCLICEKDISSNYFIPTPSVSLRTRNQRIILTRRERILLRRLRIRDRVPTYEDICCNILCCKIPVNRRNSSMTWIQINEDCLGKCVVISIASMVITSAIVVIYFAVAIPWIFVTSHT